MEHYWKSIEEYGKNPKELAEKSEFSKENLPLEEIFDEEMLKTHSSRRDFLKICGFSVGTAILVSSCENPINKAIPYLIKPEEITPGKATYYASSYIDGSDYCSILVKTREGRPIKIDGNKLSSITHGGTSARVQASVLGLYDTERLRDPLIKGRVNSWKDIDNDITKRLDIIASTEGQIVILTSSIYSPSTKKAINEFIQKYPNTKLVNYDAISCSAIILANKNSFNKEIIPSYSFDKADLIVSFGADFLGSWISPIEFTNQYVKRRKLDEGQKNMSRHIQLESGMSLTGANADKRITIKPSWEGALLANLYNELAKTIGAETFKIPKSPLDIKEIAKELLNNREKSLVVSGSNNLANQSIINAINSILGNYGKTIDLNTPIYVKQGIDNDFTNLVDEMKAGKVNALFIYNANPVYNSWASKNFVKGLEKIDLTVSLSPINDETASLCNYVCPDSHYLESWNDVEPKKGFYSLTQPAISTLFNTRQAQESWLIWSGNTTNFHDYIQANWETEIFILQEEQLLFKNFWIKSLQDGVFELETITSDQPEFLSEVTGSAIDKISGSKVIVGIELCLYEKVSIGSGSQANNPWLQEMPDPISKVAWDNYASMSTRQAKELSLKNGDIINIDRSIKLPVFIQPGQAYGTISVAYGYGRTKVGKVGNKVGTNAFVLGKLNEGCIENSILGVKVDSTEFKNALALTQTHHSMEGRKIVRETTLEKYLKDPKSGNEFHFEKKHSYTMYKEHEKRGHHWGMVIDLNSCIGCGNCTISCQVENNVPVVGKEEVRKNREMHWIRIDRYYNGDPENPETVFQPVLCQQCDNAPCENVCPTAAANHSSEGLSQMIYNRCVGTKYCSNNCPYKVRRFNWFDYTDTDTIKGNLHDPAGMTDDLKRMVLNPDVAVRTRGVMEKCSFCVQRIQEKKLVAKNEGRPLGDMEIQTACMQSCPSNAIIFGDMNNKKSKVTKLLKDERNYHLLEELHVLPSIGYLTKVRNKKA